MSHHAPRQILRVLRRATRARSARSSSPGAPSKTTAFGSSARRGRSADGIRAARGRRNPHPKRRASEMDPVLVRVDVPAPKRAHKWSNATRRSCTLSAASKCVHVRKWLRQHRRGDNNTSSWHKCVLSAVPCVGKVWDWRHLRPRWSVILLHTLAKLERAWDVAFAPRCALYQHQFRGGCRTIANPTLAW